MKWTRFCRLSFRFFAQGTKFERQSHPVEYIETGIVFTNSEKYYGFPKFKMPEILISKNYVKNWALVGFDINNNEVVVIKYLRGEGNEWN